MAQLLDSHRLNLTNSLATDTELGADLLESKWCALPQSEPELNDSALSIREVTQDALNHLREITAQNFTDGVIADRGRNDVGQRRPINVAATSPASIKRHRSKLTCVQSELYFGGVDPELICQLG